MPQTATRPLIFTRIKIEDEGGGDPAEFGLHLVESAEVQVEPVTSEVEDGQTLVDFYNCTFAVNLYDPNILDDARVHTASGDTVQRAKITFSGAVGATDVSFDGVIINGTRVFDQNRVAARLTGSKRGVSIDTITTTDVNA